MVRALTAGYETFIAGAARSRARCMKIRRRDGAIVGLTNHDVNLTFDLSDGDGSVTYRANGGLRATAHRSTADLGVDNSELDTLFAAAGVAEADLRGGKYDYAEAEIFEVNWRNFSDGRRWLDRGHLGRVTINDNGAVIEFRSLMHKLGNELLDLYTLNCRVELGSAKCGIPLDPPVWAAATDYGTAVSNGANRDDFVVPSVWDGYVYRCTTAGTSGGSEPAFGATTNDGTVVWTREEAWQKRGAVSAVTDNGVFTVPSLTPRGASSFVLGRIKFLDGENEGIVREIKSVSGDVFTMYRDFPLDVAVSDNVAVFPGCDKTHGVCQATFANIVNFRGYPHVPGNDKIIATAASGDPVPGAGGRDAPGRIIYEQ